MRGPMIAALKAKVGALLTKLAANPQLGIAKIADANGNRHDGQFRR